MSSSREIELENIVITGKDVNTIEVCIAYENGGYNHLTSQASERGYYVSVRALQKGPGFRSFLLLGDMGYKMLLEKSTRFNRKRLEALKDRAMEESKPIIEMLCVKKGLTRIV